jgi:hypothetical protein
MEFHSPFCGFPLGTADHDIASGLGAFAGACCAFTGVQAVLPAPAVCVGAGVTGLSSEAELTCVPQLPQKPFPCVIEAPQFPQNAMLITPFSG